MRINEKPHGGIKVKQNVKYGRERKTVASKYFIRIAISLIIFIAPLLAMSTVSADGGMIPYHEFEVYEPGQKAIIAWDGETEIMILSVDVYSEQSTKALHMVPFPSLPDVELGSVESFEKIEEIMNRNRYHDSYGGNNKSELAAPDNQAAVEIVFHEKVGPHDITAVQINSPSEFSEWVNNFLKGKGVTNKKMPDELDIVIEHYTQQDIRHFVFDVVDLDPSKKSVDPIVYTFESDSLFFPLEISSIIKGETEITLAFLMPTDLPVNKNTMRELGFYGDYNGIISHTDVEDISENIADILDDKASLSIYQGYFSLSELKDDVVIKRLTNVNWMYTESSNFKSYEITDIDSDGNKEITLSTYYNLYMFDGADGSVLFECNLLDVGGRNTVAQLQDLNSDGTPDIITTNWYNLVQAYDGTDKEILWEFKTNKTDEPVIDRIKGINIELGDSEIVFMHTQKSVYGLDSETSEELWKLELDEDLGQITHIYFEDIDLDGDLEITIDTSSGTILVIDPKNGDELWRIKLVGLGYIKKEFADLTDAPGQELVFLAQDAIYVRNSKTGDLIWSTDKFNDKWNRAYSFYLITDDKDGVMKIAISTSDGYHLLNGLGEYLSEVKLNKVPGVDSFDIDDLYNIQFADIDSDGKSDLCGLGDESLLAFDLTSGEMLLEFTTGEYITYYEADDIDTDGESELVLIAANKVYTVEYEKTESETDSEYWQSEQFILIGSIVLPLILIIVLQLIILKKFGKRKKTY
jgi:outer membrane protein assembly factor BamB